jgi:hypothetical protein
MVTKPTGRPRGRPKKAKSAKPKGKRGAPKKPLNDDPDRYLLAWTHAMRKLAPEISERRISEFWAIVKSGRVLSGPCEIKGRLVTPSENARALLAGKPFLVQHMNGYGMPDLATNSKYIPAGVGSGVQWHEENAFRPLAQKIRVKYRHKVNKNENWLGEMTNLIILALTRNQEVLEKARELSESIGEKKYFEELLRKILLGQHALFSRVVDFFSYGDTSYWGRNRLKRWPNQSIGVSFGMIEFLPQIDALKRSQGSAPNF